MFGTAKRSTIFDRCKPPGSKAERARSSRGRGRPPVGLAMALHPPKYYAATKFLREWWACPAAREAVSVHIVFISEADRQLFLEGQACMNPDVPADAWAGVVAAEPLSGWMRHDQRTAAYKKWYGMAHLMDLGPDAPEYGIMTDAEVLLYAFHVKDGLKAKVRADCGRGGKWSELRDRIRASEATKEFPAAEVSDTLVTYNFAGNFSVMSGRKYDRVLISESAQFAAKHSLRSCASEGCEAVRRQIDRSLFSWWTDLPWVNLTVAKGMMASLSGRDPGSVASWRDVSRGLKFPAFEYMAYQQWCVMHEGFSFRDVTNLTGFAKWGSYLEDPLPGARLDVLHPMWVSAEALTSAERGSIPPLAADLPPLLAFHADHMHARFYTASEKLHWDQLLVALQKRVLAASSNSVDRIETPSAKNGSHA